MSMIQETDLASFETSISRNNEVNRHDMQASTLEWTGERMVPEACDQDTFLEHVYRYKFAIPFIRDKNVLDIACGEGYGSAACLAGGARSVVGVDIDPDTVEHARRKYNLDARVGSAEFIPADDKTFDIIISFETIEHLANPLRFLDECVRVCRPGGRLIISTPNKMNYLSDAGSNEFHLSEMTLDDFTKCLASRFKKFSIYGQCMSWSPWWSLRMMSVAGTPSLLNIPGACRVRSLIRRALVPELATGQYRASCQNTIKLMIERDFNFSDLFNPYLVRRLRMDEEMPAYMVAVADL